MPRGSRPQDGEQRTGARHRYAPAIDPFSSSADTERIDCWDVRPDEMAQVILGYLNNGQALMFGVSSDGGAVRVGLAVGDKQWRWKTCSDAGEFIGVIHEMALALRIRAVPQREAAD